jgi:hypothetical protein
MALFPVTVSPYSISPVQYALTAENAENEIVSVNRNTTTYFTMNTPELPVLISVHDQVIEQLHQHD